MSLQTVIEKENIVFANFNGNLTEANDGWNGIQQEKINAILNDCGSAFLGKINMYNPDDSKYTEYTGQTVYNFSCDFVIPNKDKELLLLIDEWNKTGKTDTLDKIFDRVNVLGGTNLIWT